MFFCSDQNSGPASWDGSISADRSSGIFLIQARNNNIFQLRSESNSIQYLPRATGERTFFHFNYDISTTGGSNYIYSDNNALGILSTGFEVTASDVSIFNYTTGNSIGINNIGTGINRNATDYEFEVEGDIGLTGTIYGLSDRRMKKNITNLQPVLNLLMQLNPVRYQFKDTEEAEYNIGFIAQEVEEIFPDLVGEFTSTNEEEIETLKAVKYMELIPILVEAIKEQQKEIDELRSLIENK